MVMSRKGSMASLFKWGQMLFTETLKFRGSRSFIKESSAYKNSLRSKHDIHKQFNYPVASELRDIVRLPLLVREDANTIKRVWNSHFINNPKVVTHALSKDGHNRVSHSMKTNKMFIIPLPRSKDTYGESYEILYVQTDGKRRILITTLQEFKDNGDMSSACVIINLYPELLYTHGLSLIRADCMCNNFTHTHTHYILMCILDAHGSHADTPLTHWINVMNFKHNKFIFEEYLRDTKGYLLNIYTDAKKHTNTYTHTHTHANI
eukprot:GHVR01176353.1.p1 GENE.GHVR01176353.1~~GHVR01176353.1.p1  ORF type:complete len:263 (+),score=52.24 GHVR01176353.1:46-834(+)